MIFVDIKVGCILLQTKLKGLVRRELFATLLMSCYGLTIILHFLKSLIVGDCNVVGNKQLC